MKTYSLNKYSREVVWYVEKLYSNIYLFVNFITLDPVTTLRTTLAAGVNDTSTTSAG